MRTKATRRLIVYHGTNANFRRLDPRNTAQGIIWFASTPEMITSGESGAEGIKRLLTLSVSVKNPAGWEEYDKLVLDQIWSQGFDGVILPNVDGSFVGFVPKASQIKIVKDTGVVG